LLISNVLAWAYEQVATELYIDYREVKQNNQDKSL